MAEVKQPAADIQKLASEVMEQQPETVVVCGKKRSITWLKNRTVRKFSHIMTQEQDPWKRNVKVCACVLLNRKWGLRTWFNLKVWYHVYWRWLFYVRDIDQVEVMGVLDASKKKIQSTALALATTLTIGMTDLMMTMAQHESTRVAQDGV